MPSNPPITPPVRAAPPPFVSGLDELSVPPSALAAVVVVVDPVLVVVEVPVVVLVVHDLQSTGHKFRTSCPNNSGAKQLSVVNFLHSSTGSTKPLQCSGVVVVTVEVVSMQVLHSTGHAFRVFSNLQKSAVGQSSGSGKPLQTEVVVVPVVVVLVLVVMVVVV